MDKQQPILPALAAADPEIADRLVTRRSAIRGGAAVSGAVLAGLRLATAPVALAALARDAFGQGRLPAAVNSVLNFALVLEELEYEFYVRAVSSGSFQYPDITTSPRTTTSPDSPTGSARPSSSTTRTSTSVRGEPTLCIRSRQCGCSRSAWSDFDKDVMVMGVSPCP